MGARLLRLTGMILATLTGVALTRLYDHSPRAHRVVNWFWTRH